jgi:leader peptidase (prepilin peptidase) / N-methyltransferase
MNLFISDIWFYFVIIFIFGTIIGSFLNVVILRFNTGKSIVNDHSRCMTCGKNLAWFNLIPLFSWIFQRGKCTNCSAKISIQYPLVEFVTGVIFVILFNLVSNYDFLNHSLYFITFFYWAIIFSIFIVICVYDYRHKIIPDEFSYDLIILGAIGYVTSFLFNNQIHENWWQNLALVFTFPEILNVLIGPIFFLGIFLIWYFSRGRAIGFGDAKLLLGLGLIFGFSVTVNGFFIAVWIATIVAIFLMLISKLEILDKHITMKSEIPFGPFLILGAVLAFLLEIDFLGLDWWFNL